MAQFVMCSQPIVKDPNQDRSIDAENAIINIDIVRDVYTGTSTTPWYVDNYPSITFIYPDKDAQPVVWFYDKTKEGEALRNRDFGNILRIGKLVDLGKP